MRACQTFKLLPLGRSIAVFSDQKCYQGNKRIVGMSLFLWHYEKYFAFVPRRCTFNKKTAREFKSWSIFILTLKRKRITSFSSRGRGKETKNIAEFSEWVEVSSTDLILKHYDVRVKNRKIWKWYRALETCSRKLKRIKSPPSVAVFQQKLFRISA